MSLPAKTTYTYGQIWAIAYPILLATLMEQLIGTTATAFLGRVGEVELGASALAGIFYIAVFMLGMGFSVGSQILMGRRNGEGRYAEIGNIFYHSLAFLLLFALVLFVLTKTFAPHILQRIIAAPEVYAAADDYLQWRVYGFFFAFVNVTFRAFYVATTHTRPLTLNSLTMVVSNVFFDYILIFGHLGLPAFGIAGAAMGNVLAEACSTVFFVIHTYRTIPFARYGLDRLPRLRLSMLGHMLGISVWMMIQNFLSLATWFIFFLAVEHLGERQLAASNIVRNISAFTFMTVISLASTTSTLTSNLMGRGHAEAVRPMVFKVIRLGFMILTPALVVIALVPDLVMSVFSPDPVLLATARPALWVLLSSYLFTIPAQILFLTVSGTGNTRTALCIELLSVGLYTAYIFVAIFHYRVSLGASWMSEYVYNVLVVVLCGLYLRFGRWKERVI